MKTIPFQDRFTPLIQSGHKTYTARTKRQGEPGEYFNTPAGRIKLLQVIKTSLETVRDDFYQDEGCESPEEFESVWKSIHPRRGFREDDQVFLHQFEFIGGVR